MDAAVGAAELMASSHLDNGVHVLTERIPGARSAAVGVWVRYGSAHEQEGELGASHLVEHMVFKGTERRSARDIALALEGLGGSLDAYTSREHTSYQARVLDEHLGEALDVLADLVTRPLFRPADLELEREVVLEEIAQVDDTPDDLVFELHSERLWTGHPYGSSILGTRDSVKEMRVDTLRSLHERRYRGGNLVVAGAGNVDHDDFVARVVGHFGALSPGEASPVVSPPAAARAGDERVDREGAQIHVVFGCAVPPHSDPVRWPLILLSAALGTGMSSRLFQRVREDLGLCYAIYTFQSFYRASGLSGLYVGTRAATEEQAVQAIRDELAEVARDGLSEGELEQIQRQVKGQVSLSLESTGARLYRLASFALHEEPFLGLDALLEKIDSVTFDEVREAAARYFDPDRHLVVRLGPASA